MEALLVTQLMFAAYDTPSLQTDLIENANQVASERNLSPIITAAVAAALQKEVAPEAMIWL